MTITLSPARFRYTSRGLPTNFTILNSIRTATAYEFTYTMSIDFNSPILSGYRIAVFLIHGFDAMLKNAVVMMTFDTIF